MYELSKFDDANNVWILPDLRPKQEWKNHVKLPGLFQKQSKYEIKIEKTQSAVDGTNRPQSSYTSTTSVVFIKN